MYSNDNASLKNMKNEIYLYYFLMFIHYLPIFVNFLYIQYKTEYLKYFYIQLIKWKY